MRKTQWFEFPVPGQGDEYDVDQFGAVADAVDTELHRLDELLAALPEAVAEMQAALNEHEARITSLENALYNDVTANSFVNKFDEISYLNVTGIWNKPMQRIEC